MVQCRAQPRPYVPPSSLHHRRRSVQEEACCRYVHPLCIGEAAATAISFVVTFANAAGHHEDGGSPTLCSAEEHAVSALRSPWIPPCAPHRPYRAAGKCSTLPNRYSWLLACSLVSRYSHTRFTAAREGGRSSVRYETVAVGHCTTVG